MKLNRRKRMRLKRCNIFIQNIYKFKRFNKNSIDKKKVNKQNDIKN
jgi:hypothetical protein